MNISVILPAAGLGRRFAVGDRNSASKIEFELLHKPVFLRTIELFQNFRGDLGGTNFAGEVGQILLAVNPDKLDDFQFRWGDQLAFLGVTLIAGGAVERWETVQIALDQVSEGATHVAVHDAARPCASVEMIERVFVAAEKYGAAVPGVAMGDTVKRVQRESGEGENKRVAEVDPLDALFGDSSDATIALKKITETIPRHDLYRVQTPQVFEKGLLVAAYAALDEVTAQGITDDASVVELAGKDVYIVEGDAMNLKLTTPGDVELMEAVLKMRAEKDAKDAAVKQLFRDDDDD
ncbi:MAG: 2-C-methyl-D-erythritol 4-phosphate cytidylyltransferase [Phycisphaeraceae bacterium]